VVDAETVSLLLVFAAAAAFALGSVLTQRIDASLPIETLEAWAMLVGAVVMHGISVGIGESAASVEVTLEAIFALGYLVVVASAFGFLVYFDLLDRLGPIEINLVSYAAPLAAAATGFLVLGEQPTPATAGGFVCILVGFALIKRGAIRAELGRAGIVDG
jgi:drug/metabolite transporter (DMT)-like permease